MTCPNCKAEQSKQAKFCTACGATSKKRMGWIGREVWTILALVFVRALWFAPGTPPSPAAPSRGLAKIGDVVMMNHGKWVCASSKDALDEVLKWAVRGDNQEMLLALRRTGSFMLMPDGWQVKILDASWITRKVRVLGWLDPDDGQIHAYPDEQRIGRECWVPMEAIP
jgi:hypothetical protein